MVIIYLFSLVFLAIFSYGFTDPHLVIAGKLHELLFHVVYYQRPVATVLFLSILLVLFSCFLYFLKHHPNIWVIIASAVIMVFSYPALTYDLFNYMTTAKVTYLYRENPYIVMPIEIPDEPNLAFTRAANKVALYGPVWLLLTAIPNFLGAGNVWQTIIAFKAMNAIVYLGFCYFIYRQTKNYSNIIFFALNPLVLIEVLMNGHNDIYMMVLALVALRHKNVLALIASWFVKGATMILTPLLFIKNISWERMLIIAYCLLSLVFFVVAPLREELYPWYAVWLVMVASLLPLKSHRFIAGFTVVLSFALELRALPYMWMGYYEGPGPFLRFLLTIIPVLAYCLYFAVTRKKFRNAI